MKQTVSPILDRTEITRGADVRSIEASIALLQSKSSDRSLCELKMSTDQSSKFFREQWLAMIVAEATRGKTPMTVVAWGQQTLPEPADDENYGFSLPIMLALQRGAPVLHDGTERRPLDAKTVRRGVSESRQGMLGAGGAPRRLVEFDPEYPTAPILRGGSQGLEVFAAVIGNALSAFEVTGIGRGTFSTEHGAKRTLVKFLYELHANASQYGRAIQGVRMLRLQKHIGSSRERLLDKAGGYEELRSYVSNQIGYGAIHLVEASISDFGPGIVRSFLGSYMGKAHAGRPESDILHDLVHSQLSEKSDPGAGLGIPQALAAARRMFGFVSLRTGRHWLYLDGSISDEPKMRPVPGDHPEVVGTHWQLLYPDMSPVSSRNGPRASI